jgi:GTPase SAR1 family protein
MISSDTSPSLLDVEGVPSLRLVVVGDCGVGKSLFISALLHQSGTGDAPLSGLRVKGYTPTIGCELHVMACTHPKHGDFFVEVLDIGGNPTFRGARAFFYEVRDLDTLWNHRPALTTSSLD